MQWCARFVSRPRAESKSDISFVPNTGVSRHTSRETVQFKEQGNRQQLERIFLNSGVSRCSGYLLLLIKIRCKLLSTHFVLVNPNLRQTIQSRMCFYWKLMCWKSLLKCIFSLFQMEIDTALSDLEAADFAELVNILFLFALHSISLPWCHIQWCKQALFAKSIDFF